MNTLASDFKRCRSCDRNALSPELVAPGDGSERCTSCRHNYDLIGDLRERAYRAEQAAALLAQTVTGLTAHWRDSNGT